MANDINQIDGNGIQVKDLVNILQAIIEGTPDTPGFKQIYGSDINVDSNTPDGNMIYNFGLAVLDVLDLIVQDYNSKDPDQAVGVALDAISQLCGLRRKGGVYTKTKVTITADRTLNLNGLDTNPSNPFTVADLNGNLFYLITSATINAGDNVLDFRAANIGFVQVLQNTIVVAVTVVLGVTVVNNPLVPFSIGQDQETDAIFRLRRQKSTSLPSQGFLQSLYAGLNSLEGLAQAVVYENNDNVADLNLIPAHSIWVIVDGGADLDVANMIYKYRNAGCGMRGSVVVAVTQVDGTAFNIYFDRAIYEPLYIKFTVASLSGGSIDISALKTALASAYVLGIYDPADITSITALVKSINPDLVVSGAGVSDTNSGYITFKRPSTKQHRWTISTANMDIT